MRIIFTIALVIISVIAHAGNNKWTSSGPSGGSFNRFGFHPQIKNLMFASGTRSFISSDAIFRSRNAGQSWERLELSGSMVVRVHPRAPQSILAAGWSLFKSTDQGTAWREISKVPDRIDDWEFHPDDPQTLYAITWRKGCLKSTDGGLTWIEKNSGLDLNVGSWGGTTQIEVDPVNGNVVYVLLPSQKVFKSTNGGDSWKDVSKGLDFSGWQSHALAIDPKSSQTLYAGGAGIFKTTNGGAQWSDADCDCGVRTLALDPRNTQTIYGDQAGGGGIIKSTDGGGTWNTLHPPSSSGDFFAGVAVHPGIKNLVFAGAFGTGIYRSKDAGKSWQEASSGLDAYDVGSMKVHTQRDGTIYALGFPHLLVSENFGRTWKVVEGLLDPFFSIQAAEVHSANPDLIAVAGTPPGNSAFALSTDGGKTFALKSSYSSVFCDCIQFHPQDQNTIYLAPNEEGHSGHPNDDRPLGVAKSTNQGDTWKLVNSGISDRNVTVIRIDPRNGSAIFVGTKSGKIFKTTNSGSSWKNTGAGLSGRDVTAIAIDPSSSQVVYAAIDIGMLFKSTNSGSSWQLKNTGIPNFASLSDIRVHPSNSRTVFAASGEAGLLVSTDGAESWSAFDTNGLGPLRVNSFLKSPWEAETFYIGTSRGVFSYTIAGLPNGPIIEQLSPPAAKLGDTIDVNGRNFGPTQGTSTVSFSGVNSAAAQFWSNSQIRTRVPEGTRTGPVVVSVAGRKSNPYEFILLPTSGSIEPTSGSSAGGTRVAILSPSSISGTQFNVLFGSALARDIRFTAPNIITCFTPPGTGAVEVSVTSSAVVVKVGTFTYQ